MLFVIAWRNLWRNRRRTLITMSAVAGGLMMILIANGFMNAMTDRMLAAMTSSFIGHAQIHREGYREKHSAGLTLTHADRILDAVRSTKGVVAAAGRVYGLAHAAIVRSDDDNEIRRGGGEDVSAPVVALLGIDPDQEKQVTDLATRVTKGRWLEGELDVVVGAGLAKRNDIQVGDAFLPTSADNTGAMRGPWAVGESVPRVVGIARTGMEKMDNNTVFMSRAYLAKLQRMEGEVHEIALRVDAIAYPDLQKLDPVIERIREKVRQARSSTEVAEALSATGPLHIHGEGEEAHAPEPPAQPDAGAAPEPQRLEIRLAGVDVTLSEDVPEASSNKRLEGRFLARSDDIIIPSQVAKTLGVAPGARIVVDVPVDCGEDIPAADCPPSAETFHVAGVLAPEGADDPSAAFGLVAASVLSGNIAALNEGLVSELSDEELRTVASLSQELRGDVSEEDEVLAWYGIAPELSAMLAAMDAGPLLFLFIIFLAVSVGIVNTMLMATFERTREIGTMMALGLRPRKVVAMVMVESAMLGLFGVIVGLALGGALVGYWSIYGATIAGEEGFSFSGVTFDPTLYPRLTISNLVKAGIPVFIMTSLAGLWPAILASRLRPTVALRQD